MHLFYNKSPFHLVHPSPWPLFCSLSAFSLMVGGVLMFRFNYNTIFFLVLFFLVVGSFLWWKDVILESLSGYHTFSVMKGLQFGMLLFIASEVLFFFSFFWAFFHSCWGAIPTTGFEWPPYKMVGMAVDPYSMPLLNTVLLLSSGATMTWTHHSILYNGKVLVSISLFLTLFLGFTFLVFQFIEYSESNLSIKSMVFGSVFFLLTGFHGFHVTIGVVFLSVCLFRHFSSHFNSKVHVGFECAAWYWHFVDVVWLFLFVCLYWYGSSSF